MKTFKTIILTMAICCGTMLQAQEFKETIKKELRFSSSNANERPSCSKCKWIHRYSRI